MNEEVLAARDTYSWEDVPKLLAITSDEDFLAVTEDNEVVQICANEGNVDVKHGALEGWVERYIRAAEQRCDDPSDEDVGREDPEAEHQ